LTTHAIIAGLQLRNENGIRTILDSVKSSGCRRLACKCNASQELARGLRQFDPYDKRTTARFPFIGTPDIRSRKTPEDQQEDEFMAVS